MPNVPDMGVFAEVQPFKGFTIFASFNQWLGALTGRVGYFLTPNIVDDMFRLNVGLRWQLID
jgi:hypothetical protein